MARRHRGDGAVYQRANGMWIGTVDLGIGGDGKRRRKTVSSLDHTTTLRKLRALHAAIEAGTLPSADRTTVAQWMEHWLNTIAKPRIRPNTFANYRTMITHHITPHIGAYRLTQLSPAHVRTWHRAVLDSHPNGRGERNAQLAHRILSRALTDAQAEGIILRNPAQLVSPPAPKASTRGALSAAHARLLLSTAEAGDDPMLSRWAAALMLGARQGELLGLTWDRVDLDRGMVDLAWQLQSLPQVHGCGGTCGHTRASACPQRRFDTPPGYESTPLHASLCLTRPKSKAGTRVVPIIAPLAVALEQHRMRAPANEWNLVWTHNDRPIDRRADHRRWQAALDAAGLPAVPLHSARHSCATLLMEAGVDAHVISSILGHTDVVVTNQYRHVSLELARSGMENLGSLMELPRINM